MAKPETAHVGIQGLAAVFVGIGGSWRSRFSETFAGAEWDPRERSVFARFMRAKSEGTGIWGRSFDVSKEQNTVGIERLRWKPVFRCSRRQTLQRAFRIWRQKIYHAGSARAQRRGDHDGRVQIVSQFLLQFFNTLRCR